MRAPLRFIALIGVLVVVVHFEHASGRARRAKSYGYRVAHTYPHDRTAFTQGLEFRGGFLYESTGLSGRSELRKERLESGEVLETVSLGPEFFGEGITVLNQRILQLTWRSHRGFVYDQASF